MSSLVSWKTIGAPKIFLVKERRILIDGFCPIKNWKEWIATLIKSIFKTVLAWKRSIFQFKKNLSLFASLERRTVTRKRFILTTTLLQWRTASIQSMKPISHLNIQTLKSVANLKTQKRLFPTSWTNSSKKTKMKSTKAFMRILKTKSTTCSDGVIFIFLYMKENIYKFDSYDK